MDTPSSELTPVRVALSGALIAIFIVALPALASSQWHRIATSPDRTIATVAVGGIAILWLWVLSHLTAAVIEQWRERTTNVPSTGIVWLAAAIVVLLTYVTSSHGRSSIAAPVLPSKAAVVATVADPWPQGISVSGDGIGQGHEPETARQPSLFHDTALGPLPLALIAKRRRDTLRQARAELADDEIDDAIAELRHYDVRQLAALKHAAGDADSGVVAVSRLIEVSDSDGLGDDAVVAVALGTRDDATLVAFARPGHELPLGEEGVALVDRFGVLLTDTGQCQLAATPDAAIRSLALRASFDDVVIYLGRSSDLDPDIASRCVGVGDGLPREGNTLFVGDQPWRAISATGATHAFVAVQPMITLSAPSSPGAVRVELLRAEPTVTGLQAPFTPTLRRRCVEMTAYLAVHHHEGVSGDRLRTRVLGTGSDDASLRTLANTASAVRRSLGHDDDGPRLRPVTPGGTYRTQGVSCDVVEFHQLVATARAEGEGVADTLRAALSLVRGEPLATALRGFEWFLAEGHLARLQRDGEWAALRLAAEARERDDLDLAFWAIEQGRLLDPYSETLEAALHRVPRLRQFGGDGARGAQDEAVGAR